MAAAASGPPAAPCFWAKHGGQGVPRQGAGGLAQVAGECHCEPCAAEPPPSATKPQCCTTQLNRPIRGPPQQAHGHHGAPQAMVQRLRARAFSGSRCARPKTAAQQAVACMMPPAGGRHVLAALAWHTDVSQLPQTPRKREMQGSREAKWGSDLAPLDPGLGAPSEFACPSAKGNLLLL